MSTLHQIEANRRNAQKSTGPTSVTGKAVSSMNSLKTGIHAKSLVLPYENFADLEQLIEECYHHYLPTNPEARFFVDDLIRCEWTLRRLDNAETQSWLYQNDDKFRTPQKYPLGYSASCNPNSFSKIQYRLDATRRARQRALLALEKLSAKTEAAPDPTPAPVVAPPTEAIDPPTLNPSPQTTSPQIGFVPPTSIPTSGTDQTYMNLRRSLPETRCQSCPSPVSPAAPNPGPNAPEPVGARNPQIR
jgi:hypothetical protein